MSRLKNVDYKMFAEAYKMAMTSDFPAFKIGCVLSYKGHIIGRGCNMNKTTPVQKKYNRYRQFNKGNKPIRHTGHAEIRAIHSVPYTVAQEVDWKKVKIYVYRISPGKQFGHGLARPCDACRAFIKEKGIREIFYTTDDGYAMERIEY